MAFIVGLPVVQIILFCYAIGHDPTGLPVAVANYELDSSHIAAQKCPTVMGCNYTYMSCRYLNMLQEKTITLVSISKEEDENETNFFPR